MNVEWLPHRRSRALAFVVAGGLSLCVAAAAAAQQAPGAGLWYGKASVEAVSDPASVDPETPVPVIAPFEMPLIVHIAPDGTATLLKEVVLMAADGELDAPGAAPRDSVLVADMRKLRALAEGRDWHRRISSAAFAFAGASLPFDGTAVPGGALSLAIELAPDLPDHPYRHQYHPDHDELDDDRMPLTGPARAQEVYAITRAIRISLDRTTADEIAGSYAETITGLHKRALHVAGRHSLSRISRIGVLQ